jgi:hypothetical protein
MLLTLLPYLTVAGNLVLVLGLLLGVAQGVRRLRKRVGQHETAAQAETAELKSALQELKNKIQQLEETGTAQPSSVAAFSGNGWNGALRTRVLKMHRLGQATEQIAGSLRIPKGEVDLLVKVNRIVLRPYDGNAAQAQPAEAPEKP